ncbi:MAG: O-antigen ligase family protein [Acidobacteriota bacterium]
MSRERIGAACFWAIVFSVFVATIWFGAVEDEVRYLLFAATILASAGVVATAKDGPSIGRRWYWVLAGFPIWIALSLIPIPSTVLQLINPESARVWNSAWPGAMLGCSGVIPDRVSTFRPPTLDSADSWQFLFQVVAALMVFWAASSSGERAEGRRITLLWMLAMFGAAEAVYGLAQWLSNSPMVLWYEKEAYKDCATGTLINRNHFAMLIYLSIGAVLVLARMTEPRTGIDTGRADARRLTLVAIFAGLIAGLAASKSRAGLALGMLVVLSGVAWLWRGASRTIRLVSVGFGLLIAVPALWVAVPALYERAAIVGADWSDPQSRGAVLRLCADIVARYPIFGTGAGTFAQTFTFYRPAPMQVRYQEAHNDYLQVLVETGLIGLALAIVPIIAVAVRVISARKRTGVTWDLSIWVALGAVALHEAVDFPLRIPSLLLLVALLAGLHLPRPLGSVKSSATSRWLLAGALVLSPLSACYGLAYWEPLGMSPTWPKLAEREYREVIRLAERSRTESSPQLLCNALAINADVQRRRPLSGPYSIRYARLLLAASDAGVISPAIDAETVRDEVARAADRARRVDAWNTNLVRYPLIGIELSLGQPDRALQDADAVCSLNSELAPGIVEDLYRAGFPPGTLATRFMPYSTAFQRVLQLVIEAGDMEIAGSIVPADIKPSPSHCFAGGEVREILDQAHGISAIAFLQGCLAEPSVLASPALQDYTRIWIVRDLLSAKRWDEASKELAGIKDEASKKMFEMEIGLARQDWPAVRRAIVRWIDLPRTRTDEGESYLYCMLGDALAHTGDLAGAAQAYRKALNYDPTAEHIKKRLSDLELGRLPE